MLGLRNASIKRKLITITMVTSGVALLLAVSIFVAYDMAATATALAEDLKTTAAIIGDNSTAALSFNDPDSAAQTLRSLATHPNISGAVIYDKAGHVFAIYDNPAFKQLFSAPPVEPAGHRIDRYYYELFSRIDLAGETIGTVYLQCDLGAIHAGATRHTLVFLLTLLAASAIAFLLSTKLQVTISAPISQLAAIAKQVAAEKNYAVRAIKQGEDEFGNLIDGFNEMLDQIQQRDSALQQARADSERLVEERTRELANSLSLLNATIESSADGIFAHQFSESGPGCFNTQYLRIWNVPPHLVQSHSVTNEERIEWLASQTKDPQRFLERVKYCREHPDTEQFDVIELKNGTIVERYFKPQCIDGKQVGIVINVRDITARKQAERELELAHQQVVEISRQAGMAEVATGVLHNVGNVLNSVNVSANLVAEAAKSSKVAGLGKVAKLLSEHQHDLGEFIGNDAKGKHLPAYLTQLCEHLLAEHRAASRELDNLRSNIDHIKQIVSMQQSYAKVSGVKEVVNVVDLVEDTLRMNSGALQRHGVQINCEFVAVPTINTEKHKILQILVNLVRNAKYACSESGRTDKQLTLRVNCDQTHIRIAVTDNGIGIGAENLTRIFGHGFTTRKDGHGFGLHSGALAARELGGALRVHSEGIGLGATFTLELPLAITESAYA